MKLQVSKNLLILVATVFFGLFCFALFARPAQAAVDITITLTNFNKEAKTVDIGWLVSDPNGIDYYKIYCSECTNFPSDGMRIKSDTDTARYLTNLTNPYNVEVNKSITVHAYNSGGQSLGSASMAPSAMTPTSGSGGGGPADTDIGDFSGSNALIDYITKLYDNYLILIGSALATIMLVWSGIQYITSSGNPEGVEAAKNRALITIMGYILLLLVSVIYQFLVTPISQ